MANYYNKISFEFTVNATESDLISDALAHDWEDEDLPINKILSDAFGDREGFLTSIFPDPDDPYFNVDEFSVENGTAWIAACECPNLEAIANLIQHVCRDSLQKQPVGFEWASDCSRLRVGAFGGGWCLIQSEVIDWGSTSTALNSARSAAALKQSAA